MMKWLYKKTMVKCVIHYVFLLLGLFLSAEALAGPILGPTSSWSSAQTGRTWMDIGVVWNGTTIVTTTGDHVSFVLNNTQLAGVTQNAYDIKPSVLLPTPSGGGATSFVYVPGTAGIATSGTGCTTQTPTVTANQVLGSPVIDFTLSPVGYDLYAQCQMTITYDIRVDNTGLSGTSQLFNRWQYAATQGGVLNVNPYADPFNVLVQAGAVVLTKTPEIQAGTLNAAANWTVNVTNTGLGALFNVSVDEYALNPSASLTFNTITSTAPTGSTLTNPSTTKRVINYLAPGATFSSVVNATIKSCKNIDNTVYSTDRTGKTNTSSTAHIVLTQKLPNIAVTVNPYTLAYNAATPMSVTIKNTGTGVATGFTLQTNLVAQGMTVSAILGTAWTYNTTTGVFTYGAGTVAAGANLTLNFSVAATNMCTLTGATNIRWTAKYSNECAAAYNTPSISSVLSAPAAMPSLALTNQSVAAGTTTSVIDRFVVGTAERFVVGFSATNATLINGTSFVVQNTLPAGTGTSAITGITLTPSLGTTATCPATICLAGDVITWTVPNPLPATPPQLLIDYTAPSNTCLGGTTLSNAATVTATSAASTGKTCNLSTNATAAPLLTNNPAAAVTQSFNLANAPSVGTSFETGSPDLTPFNTRATTGEGEFIAFNATYNFGAGAGTWVGSTFQDDFAGSGASLVPNTLKYNLNGAGAVAVPAANVTCTVGTLAGNNCSTNMSIDLGFITANTGNVAGQSLIFTYQTTVPDAALGALSTKKLTQLVTMTVAAGATGGTTGACAAAGVSKYTQGAFVPMAKAEAKISLSMPTTIDVCEPATATMTVSNASEEFASNVMTSFPTGGNYNFPTPQTPTYGGLFTAGNMTYAPNGGTSPTFTLTPKLSANGTITFVLQLKRGSTTTPVAAQVRVDYDDYQTSTTIARDFYATGSFTPTIVRKGLLVISMTPQQYTVTGKNVSWKIFVTNVGDGVSFGAALYNTLPTGMTLDTVATNTSNAAESCSTTGNAGLKCNNVAVTGQKVSWALGDIPPGSTRTIVLNATVGGGICSIANGSNDVYAQWGCAGVAQGPAHVLEPNFTFPAGQMQVVHDTVNSFAPLCGVGKDVIIVRNTGTPDILDAYAQEVLNTATTGLTFVTNTVQYSTDSGATWSVALAAYNPIGLGTSALPYKWTKAQIPALADLYSATGGGVNEVRIRFDITVGEKANNAPTITAYGAGTISCGNPVSSLGTPYVIPVSKPNIKVVKTGRNNTVSPTGAFNAIVYGGSGDVIDWYVTVQNTGSVDAYNVRFQDVFAGSGATTMSLISGPVGAPVTITDNTVVSFSNLLKNTTQAYHFKETLGATCTGFASNNTANITWGCINKGAAAPSNLPSSNPGVTPATPVSGKAQLIMTPGFGYFTTNPTAQTITPQAAGRTQVVVAFDNGGGTASTLSLSSTAFPAGMMLDPYAAITVTGTAVNTAVGACVTPNICLDGTATATGLSTSPTFTLGGTGMRNGTGAQLKFFMVPMLTDDHYATAYPALALAEPNASNNILDPLVSNYGGNLSLSLSSPSTCANAQTNVNTKFVDPLMPDLDMTVSPAYAIVTDGYTMNFDFNFKNVGEVNSTADYMQIKFPIVKTGLTINSVNVITSGTGGWTGLVCGQVAGVWTCADPSLWSGNLFGYVGTGTNLTVRVNVTAHDNGFPMTLVGDVKGQFFSQSQNGNGAALTPKVFLGAYSHDRAAPRILGLNFKKILVKTSETFTADPYGAIGEEFTYDLYARFFGGDTALAPAGGAVFQNMVMRDTLLSGLGLVSMTAQSNNTLVVTTTGITPAATPTLSAGVINMNIANYSAVAAVFDYYATARVLNTTANVDGTNLLNSFGGSLNYQGQVFRSNNATDGFTGGTALSSLHAEYTAVVHRPTVTIGKTVRNVTAAGTFAATATGSAGDTYEYKVVLTNTSTTTPAYDLKVVDNLPTTLVLIDGAGDGVDNDGDTLIDGADANEGKFTVVAAPTGGGSIIFNDVYAAMPPAKAGADFTKLNAGGIITLLYRAVGNPSKVGASATVVNTATATYTTLLGNTGTAMSAPLRASGLVDGEGSTDVYSQASISMVSRVSGTVYLDADKSNTQNGAEAGTGLTLYVKLIDNAAPTTAFAVQAVDPTTGVFAFPVVAAGTYHTIVDTNTTLTDVTATIPTSWIGTQTPNQIRAAFTLAATGSKTAEDFGLFQSKATLFSGRVFEDNGIGGGTAHNAIQDGGEKGIPKVKIELTDCSTNIYATAYSNGSGDFTLALLDSLGVLDGSALCIQESNPSSYLSTGGNVGTMGGTYTIATDKMSFTLNKAGSPFSGVLFGDIAPNTFLTDNVGTAMPGAIKFYPHQFTAGTAGSVVFSSAAVGNPANTGWANVLYEDANCNQQLDVGEQQLTPTTVLTLAADSYTCILDKQFVPSNMPYDSRNLVTLTATFTYVPTNANLPVKTYTHTDTTIVGQEGLVLHKAVDKAVAKPGQVIIYTITYTNPTQGVLNNIVIHDATPAYTVFKSAQCLTKGTGITACLVGTPALAVGAVGSIAWNLTGSLQPGGSGTVSYQVTVN